MAGKPTVSLTTISGGINRLRTKGGADKNALYDLLNGYVTQSNTVKVRPGTLRNADIALYSGAGLTKGLVAWQDAFHVFSHEVVSVPDGYELHVLNHPAAQQLVQSTSGTAHTGTFNAGINLSSFPFAGSWETAGYGYLIANGSSVAPNGQLASPASGSITSDAFMTANCCAAGAYRNGGFQMPILVMKQGTLPTPFTLTMTTPDGTGEQWTYNSTDAIYFPGTSHAGGPTNGEVNGVDYWVWNGRTDGHADFLTDESTVFTINPAVSTVANIIPINKIYFAAPFLGGLYVVAEFSVTQTSILTQYGDTFHYWIQSSESGDNSNAWEANTDYLQGQVVIPTTENGLTYIASRRNAPNPIWTASTIEAIGNIVEPSVANGFQFTVTNVEGATPTTGTSEPVWPTADGATVSELSALASDETFLTAAAATGTVMTPINPNYTNGYWESGVS